MSDYSYIGSGRIYLEDNDDTLGLLPVGNCSALDFGITEDTKELKDYTQPGGGTYNEVKRISAVECKMTLHDLSPDNIARAIYGISTAVASGTVTDESHASVVEGAFVATTFLPTSITTVKVGATTMTETTDYIKRPGGIEIVAGGGINGGDTVLITYAKAGADVVQALLTSGKEYKMIFDGLNEARSGKKTRITVHRCKVGAAQNLSLIGDDYAALEVSGKCLKDTTKDGSTVSQYFKVEIEQ
jgi:hypothetical protein